MNRKYLDRLLTVIIVFLVMFVLAMLLAPMTLRMLGILPESRAGMLTMALVQSVVAFIAPSLIAARLISRRPLEFLSLDNPPHWVSLLGVVVAFFVFLPALNQIIFWNANISFPRGMEVLEAVLKEMEERAQDMTGVMMNVTSTGGLIVNLLIVGLITAVGEEFFFRGTLQTAIGGKNNYHGAIWLTAFIFSAFHMQIYGFIPRLLLGAWFGYLLYWTRSIYVPILAHLLNNGMVVYCSWLTARGSEINFDMIGVTEYGFPVPAFISALASIFFIVYFKNIFFNSRRPYPMLENGRA